MAEVFVIGDIHGGLKALQQLLVEAPILSSDSLIFLGDYVDGWSQSYELIEYLLKLSKEYDCVFIKGNHDLWAFNWLKGESPNPLWLQHGGQATINSYFPLNYIKRKRHLQFFESMLDFYIDSKQRLFIHAGFTSLQGPIFENPFINLLWDRTLWEEAMALEMNIFADSNPYPSKFSLFSEIYVGHTPTTNFSQSIPMKACNVWNIDTGAAFKGKLTIMNVNTKEFWQSSALIDLYPNENGRN